MHFWNGNKSEIRQAHEMAVIRAIRDVALNGQAIIEDKQNFPGAKEEGEIFQRGFDLTTTVAGNPKFKPGGYLEVASPLCGGILGCRVLVVRQEDLTLFTEVSSEQLKKCVAGIPDTWADAKIMASNGYRLIEHGTLEDIFSLLQEKQCDYIPLGINEVEALFNQHAHIATGLAIEPTLMLYYPLPIVIYVNPDYTELHQLLCDGVKALQDSGQLQAFYQQYYADSVQCMQPQNRRLIYLKNPSLTANWASLTPFNTVTQLNQPK